MNKAFTLAELMGVIVILGIIATIVTFTVDRNIKNGRQTTCQTQEKTIIEAAKTWSIDNPGKLPTSDTDVKTVSIGDLKDGGYLEDIISPMTKDEYSYEKKVEIKITKNNETGKYNHDYTYIISYGTDEEKCS